LTIARIVLAGNSAVAMAAVLDGEDLETLASLASHAA
jgi:hypothetical protein